MSTSGLGGGKSWVRIVPTGFELIFTIFLAFKKGEGVSAVLLAIFIRKKGSDSPFFIILFTGSYCRLWTKRLCPMLNCAEFGRAADARSEPQMGRYDVRRRVTEPVRSTDCGRAAARRRSTRRDRSGSSPCTKSQPRRARSRSARRAAPRRPRSRTSALSRDLGVSAIVTRDQGRVNGDPCKPS